MAVPDDVLRQMHSLVVHPSIVLFCRWRWRGDAFAALNEDCLPGKRDSGHVLDFATMAHSDKKRPYYPQYFHQ